LSRVLGLDLLEIISDLPRIARYTMLLIRTTLAVVQRAPSLLVIQCPSIVLGVWAACMKRVLGFTLVADLHNDAVRPYSVESRLHRRLLRIVHRAADLCIVSNPNLTSVIERAGGQAFVLPDKLPELTPSATAAPASGASVVFICSFSSDEPYLEVIDAAGELGPSVTVFVTGRYRHAATLTTPPNVRLTGYLSDEDYVALVASADVVVDLTAIDDCLVCGAYEAVSLGRPLVTSDTAALREYFRLGTIYTKHDRHSLAAAIALALTDKERLAAEMHALRPDLVREWTRQKDALQRVLRLGPRPQITTARVAG
jgi:glycosyltransferase involved in cell wall biosynthesis